VQSLGYKSPFNVADRTAQYLDQQRSNKDAFDLIYPTHRAYYNDKRFIVFDKNFDKVEQNLLTSFQNTIGGAVNFPDNAVLVHARDFDKNRVNFAPVNAELQNSAPFIHPKVIASNIRYDPIGENTKVTSSDPYASIFGGYVKQ